MQPYLPLRGGIYQNRILSILGLVLFLVKNLHRIELLSGATHNLINCCCGPLSNRIKEDIILKHYLDAIESYMKSGGEIFLHF
jgi:hypothetical protein